MLNLFKKKDEDKLPPISEFRYETNPKVLKAAAEEYGMTLEEFITKLKQELEDSIPRSPKMKAFRERNNL
ncbi:MAG: hypothetical protein CMM02_05270 [Rhodopirellula sp.]|jgi:hypothetical protein|nr:hypothetical protein [Rhodopirellula sp.]|tara:strand:+ start:8100 stop:8309 length:210 start_codon:yes stop_codon:yes gene_type:complete